MKKMILPLFILFVLLVSGCSSSGEDPVSFTTCDGQVTITNASPQSLMPGKGALFTFDLDLTEGSEYRVWILPTDFDGNNNNYYYSGSPVLQHDEKNVTSGSSWRPVIDDENGDFQEYATGTATQWQVTVNIWDGSNNQSYLTDTFTHEVTWEIP